MNWHDIQKEIPSDMQRVLVTDGESVGVATFMNGKFGFGATQILLFFGPAKNLAIFTHWIAVEEMVEQVQ